MKMCLANQFCVGFIGLVSCGFFAGPCRGNEVQVSESRLGQEDIVWQYHYTKAGDNGTPAGGLILRAVNKPSGKTLVRMSIGQDSDRPEMLFKMHCFTPSGSMFSSQYVTDSKGSDGLYCNIEKEGQVRSSIRYWRNNFLAIDSLDELEEKNRRRHDLELETGEAALGSFAWKDLDGTIEDLMGDYVEPPPKEVVWTDNFDSPEDTKRTVSEELKKVIGPDAICFYMGIGFDATDVYSITKAELDDVPSWKPGEKLPLNVEDAIAKALEYASLLDGKINAVEEVKSVSLDTVSREHKDKWYYCVEFRVKNVGGSSDVLQVFVFMNGVIVEPKRVKTESIEKISPSEIGGFGLPWGTRNKSDED